MKKFYEVEAKCGHVGRNKYYPVKFYIKANNASDAARVVKKMGRVKHDHDDAILNVVEVNYRKYILGKQALVADPYMNCNTKSEQNAVWHLIEPKVKDETERQMAYRQQNSKHYDIKKVKDVSNSKYGKKNYIKYYKYNILNEMNYASQLAEAI